MSLKSPFLIGVQETMRMRMRGYSIRNSRVRVNFYLLAANAGCGCRKSPSELPKCADENAV